MLAIFFCNVCVDTRMCRLFSIKWERRRPNTTVLRHQTFRRRRWKTFFPVDWSRKSHSISPLQLVNCPSRWSFTSALGADHHCNRETGTAMYYLATELMGVLSSSSSKDFLDQVSVLFQIARCPLQCSDSKPHLIRHSANTALLSALTVMIWMSSKQNAIKKGCQWFMLSFSYDLVLGICVIITSTSDRSIDYFQRLSKFWSLMFISRVLSPQGRIKHWH